MSCLSVLYACLFVRRRSECTSVGLFGRYSRRRRSPNSRRRRRRRRFENGNAN